MRAGLTSPVDVADRSSLNLIRRRWRRDHAGMLMRGMTALALLALAGACGSDEGGTSGATGGTGGGGQAGVGGAAGSGGGAGGTGATASGGTSAGDGGDAGGAGGFATLPWEGGPAYYSKWKNGPPADPSFFPIAVWLQSPSKAAEYQAIGVNTYIGLWQGPTEAQLSGLAAAKMPVLCAQEGVWASHLANPTIQGWTHDDEPDNAQPDGNGGYGPCVEPSAIVALYQTFTKNDPSRPVYLNFGPGAANTDWIGRGVCTGKVEMYPEYVKGADIVSFDIYPVNETDPKVHGQLEYVAKGVELLRKAVSYQKPVWVWLETTDYNGTGNQPSPEQIRSEAWMALIHGARGVGYFAHVFEPSFIEAGLLANATTKAAVQKLNQEITALAPVLNTPSLADVVTVESQSPSVPIDVMVKESGGSLYVFAIAAAGGTTTAKLTVKAPVGAKAEVIGESRSVDVSAGSFSDAFSSYAVHLYQMPLP